MKKRVGVREKKERDRKRAGNYSAVWNVIVVNYNFMKGISEI